MVAALVDSVEGRPVVVVMVVEVGAVVESVMVVGIVGSELVLVALEVVSWFEGRWITMEELLFFPLYTKDTMSTPIAVVIIQAKRQTRKIFHRDQSLKKSCVTWKGCIQNY